MTLEELAAKAKDATPGPWFNHGPHVFRKDCLIVDAKGAETWGQQCLDGAFIAAANPAVVAALVAEVLAWRAHSEDPLTLNDNYPQKSREMVVVACAATDAALKGDI